MANKIVCGNHKCIYNDSTHCSLKTIALNGNGACILAKYQYPTEIKNKNEDPLKGSNSC